MKYIIYILRNKINDKVYIGQTKKILKKRSHNGKGYRGCVALYNAIKLYGWDNFYYEILEEIENLDSEINMYYAESLEKYYQDYYNCWQEDKQCFKQGYNIKLGGKHAVPSKETKIKLSIANKGREPVNKGKPRDPKTIAKMSAALKGKPSPNKGKKGKLHSTESKLKRSNSMMGNKNHFFGKHHTEESNKKNSESNKGKTAWNKDKKHTEEHRKNLSLAKLGKKLGPYKKSDKKMGANNHFFGKHHTEESNIKNSLSNKGKHAGEKNPMYGKHPISPNKGKKRITDENGKIRYVTKEEVR